MWPPPTIQDTLPGPKGGLISRSPLLHVLEDKDATFNLHLYENQNLIIFADMWKGKVSAVTL